MKFMYKTSQIHCQRLTVPVVGGHEPTNEWEGGKLDVYIYI